LKVSIVCRTIFLTVALSTVAASQSEPWIESAPPGSQPAIPMRNETIVVTGTFIPAPLSEYDRSATSIDARQSPLLFGSAIDYLQSDPTVDLHQRSPGGVQTDLTILGSTFAENLVLVNGMRVNDSQTAHHDMDIPIPAEAISRIEVLRGAGSTFYGADAMGGAVNVITSPALSTELRLRVGAGSDGFNQEHIFASLVGKRFSETIAGNRDFSSGFRPDRDFRNGFASSETRWDSFLGHTNLLLAGSDRAFGADQFYGPFASWERTKTWLGIVQQDLGSSTAAAFGYRGHSDDFVLVRVDPTLYANSSIDQSWQAALRRHDSLGDNSTFSYGAEALGESISSMNLGQHARNRQAIYANLDFRALRGFSVSAGTRAEWFSGGANSILSPTISGGFWLTQSLKFRASVSRGFRMPSYTDLYYSDPATVGNAALAPESAWSFDAGGDWNPNARLSLGSTFFSRWDSNVIDYVRLAPEQPFRATNVQRLHFTGIETHADIHLPRKQQIQLAYVFLQGDQAPLPGVVSRYAFNYPHHKGVVGWSAAWHQWLVARTRVGVTQRSGSGVYAVWGLALSRNNGALRPYLQVTNLGDATYQEVPGVIMPSRSIVAGIEWVLKRTPR
jgi:outer membrane cobalamin receptor